MKVFKVTYETDHGPLTLCIDAPDNQWIIDYHSTLENPWPIVKIKEVKSC